MRIPPSRAHYMTWINSTDEGSTEAQTLINLDFFKWLHDEYGMVHNMVRGEWRGSRGALWISGLGRREKVGHSLEDGAGSNIIGRASAAGFRFFVT